MSVMGLKPTFKDIDGYWLWIKGWRAVYARLSLEIRRDKQRLRLGMSEKPWTDETKLLQKDLLQTRAIATKMMSVREEAILRRNRIIDMRKSLEAQKASLPLEFADCRYVDFHFNKAHLEWPQIPMWVVKTRGLTFYCDHVESTAPWTTRETPDHKSTKGAIRLKNCSLKIDKDGVATIY